MRNLLDSSTQRLIKLLETLSNQEDWLTASDLSAMIGASERTISEDVDTLVKRWGQFMDIEVSAKKGIRIHNHNTAVLNRILMDLFNDSTALRFLEEILLYPHHGTEFYEEKLFVSRSTLSRLLPRINKCLAQRGMTVLRRNNVYRLVAEDEQQLRDFFTAFLIEMNGANLSKFNLPFDLRVPQTIAKRILSRHLDGPALDFALRDEVTLQYDGVFYFISLLRENQGYHLSVDYDVTGEVTEAELAYFKKHFPNITAKSLRPIHKFIHDQFDGWTSEEERALVERETAVFWEGIFEHVHPRPAEDVVQRLYRVTYALYFGAKHRPYPISELFNRLEYFSLSLKRHNLPFYRLVEGKLALLSERIGMDLSVRLNDILYWMFLAFPDFGDFTPRKVALVVSDFGFSHAEFLAEYVSRFFNSEGNPPALKAIPVRYSEKLPEASMFDFIITTIPGVAAEGKKTILVNDFPSRENMCEIYKTLMQA